MAKNIECSVCKKDFPQKSKGRLRIAKKEERGESVIWVCPACSSKNKNKEQGKIRREK